MTQQGYYGYVVSREQVCETNPCTVILLDDTKSWIGKTHLASMAIDYATTTKTIFSFISHTTKNNTSALSIMHSLMFQLASEDECLQAVLCGLSRKQLNDNLEIVVGVIKTLLNSTDSVSIIVDGVDEIDGHEREMLLKSLCDITTVCKKTRLLISSRAEHDISTILSEISSTIRVDTHNTASIQIFIDNWTKNWFSARDFLPADKSVIEDLFKPLAIKAKGIFHAFHASGQRLLYNRDVSLRQNHVKQYRRAR